MRRAMELKPELLLHEAHENVEVTWSSRRELGEAQRQIKECAPQTKDVLKQHFNDLKGTLEELLDERLQEVDIIEQETIKPLDDCQRLIEHGVNTAEDLIAMVGSVEEDEKLYSFAEKVSHIQLDSLPEVPLLVDVLCLCAQLDDSILIVKDYISKHGTVELKQKPGVITVGWCKVDDDFTDVHVGSETQFIVLHIDSNFDYQFKVYGQQDWSHFTLVPHERTSESRSNIAFWNDSQSSGVLYSRTPTYFCGQTLTFRVEIVGQKIQYGVFAEKQNGYDSLQQDQATCMSTNGEVFVNGKEMTNELTSVTSVCTVTFDIEAVTLGRNFKLRVTISSNNREVLLEQSCGSLYFGCPFFCPGWKILVFWMFVCLALVFRV
uniref:Cytokine receptor like factor 3 n=1 Tax=Gorilla gorilla gorilla TaxID=9595 RepID=A0A2I2YMQ1_GORGO